MEREKEKEKELLNKLSISKILFIDDQLQIKDDDKITLASSFFEQYREDASARGLFLEVLNEAEVHQLFEKDSYSILEDDERRELIFTIIERIDPELFYGPAREIEKKLIEFFDGVIITTAKSPVGINIKEFDLIFMDYDYSKEDFTALNKINGMDFKNDDLTYVVFLSSHKDFEYRNEIYSMIDPESRQDLFRKVSSNFLEFKALLNYISKDNTNVKDTFFINLFEVLKEFESGRLMFSSLKSIKGLLEKGVNEAIKKLSLTNSKTMKALISEKLEREGMSETTYLVDFTLSLAKNLLTDKVTEMEEIHNNLAEIQGWSCEIWDYETDHHLRELRRIELFDENINKRFSPIDFGDLFELKIGNDLVRGLLISQSCDMVVREVDGLIGRNAEFATLILEVPLKKGSNCIPISIGTDEIVFDVRKKLQVPSFILDFTSINENGNASFNLNQQIDRKFTWGNFFHEYMLEKISSFSPKLLGISNDEHIEWFNGIAYKFEKNNMDINYHITRKGRLDYLHTMSVLKSQTDHATRIPLPLDPSEKELVPLNTKLNNKKTELKFYFIKNGKKVITSAEDMLSVIEMEGYDIPAEIKQEILAKISSFPLEKFVLNDQFAGKRMLLINEENSKYLRDKGINIQTSIKSFSVEVRCPSFSIENKQPV